MADERGRVYREALNHLSDAEWGYATIEAVRTLDWFPTVKELLELAGSKPVEDHGVSPQILAALPEEAREQYIETRRLNGTGVPRLPSPEEASRAVQAIRRRSGLDRAAE